MLVKRKFWIHLVKKEHVNEREEKLDAGKCKTKELKRLMKKSDTYYEEIKKLVV